MRKTTKQKKTRTRKKYLRKRRTRPACGHKKTQLLVAELSLFFWKVGSFVNERPIKLVFSFQALIV